jgi:putative acetyltransferase
MNELAIRDAVDGDAGGLIALVAACWSEYPDIVLDVDGEVPELRAIATSFASAGGRFWVVERDGRIVASVGAVPAAEAGGLELRKLYVLKELRRRGLGARLCGLVEDEARLRNLRFVDLWSDTRFQDAHRLYERLGYRCGPATRALGDRSGTIEYYYRKEIH